MSDIMRDLTRAFPSVPQFGGVPDGTPYRMGIVTDTAGLGEQPPTVLLGENEFAQPVRVVGDVRDYNPGDTVTFINWNGAPIVVGKVPGIGTDWDEGDQWHDIGGPGEPTFAGTYSHFGAPYQGVRFRKQADGWVHLQGLAKSSVNETNVFTLPVGYRPPVNMLFTTSVSANIQAKIRVNSNGLVQWLIGGNPSSYLSLSGIIFPTKWNLAAWFNVIPENDWQMSAASPETIVRIFVRDDGWVYHTGELFGGPASDSPLHIIMRLPTNTSAAEKGQILSMVSFGPARIDVGGSSGAGNRRPDTMIFTNHGAALNQLTFGGQHYFGHRGANNIWTSMPFQNGWVNYGGDHMTCAYYKDVHGVVHLRGLAQGAAKTSNVIATLPEGYRPADKLVFQALAGPGGGVGFGRIDVYPDGRVECVLSPSSWHSLQGPMFIADQ